MPPALKMTCLASPLYPPIQLAPRMLQAKSWGYGEERGAASSRLSCCWGEADMYACSKFTSLRNRKSRQRGKVTSSKELWSRCML